MKFVRYKGKMFSVLGDSISTLEGYSVPEGSVYYQGYVRLDSGVLSPHDTWWGRVIGEMGGELLVNNSISGSMVTKHPLCETESYGCSDERTSSLCDSGRAPDVIMILLGTNDFGWEVRITPESEEDRCDISVFSVAYELMLCKLRRNFPEAEIWCLTVPVGKCTSREGFPIRLRRGGRHISELRDAIALAAEKYGCRSVDILCPDTPYDTLDGIHPNASGMATIADSVLRCIRQDA